MVLLNDFESPIQLVLLERATGTGDFNLWFQPDFGIVEVILPALNAGEKVALDNALQI